MELYLQTGMPRITIIFLFFLAACNPIRKATYKVEEEHNALYKQKALIVYKLRYNKVLFTNPTCTRCYFLKGKQFVQKWDIGDTLVIDNNMEDFYNLRFTKCM